MSIRPSVLSQPSSHLQRRNAILLELIFSIFAYGSRPPAVYEQQICPANTFFSSCDALQPIFFDHYCCVTVLCPVAITAVSCVYTAPSPAHELDFLLWQIMFLFCVTKAAFEMAAPEKRMLIFPWPLQHYPTVILHSKWTQEPFSRNSTTLTHPKNSDKSF